MSRLEKAKKIPNKNVKLINENEFIVNNGRGTNYFVNVSNNQWTCSCPDHSYRGVECKHILKCKIIRGDNVHKKDNKLEIMRIDDEISEVKNLIKSIGGTDYLLNKLNSLIIKKEELISNKTY